MLAGIYFVLFVRCLEVIRQRHVEGKLTVFLLTTSLLLFALITIVSNALKRFISRLTGTSSFTAHVHIDLA